MHLAVTATVAGHGSTHWWRRSCRDVGTSPGTQSATSPTSITPAATAA